MTQTTTATAATIVREYGPFPGTESVHGVTFDGRNLWFASDAGLHTVDPQSGDITRTLEVPAHAGTAFDGTHLYQIAETGIQKIDPESGEILATLAIPGDGDSSGLAWAEGSLWMGQYRQRKIHQLDPDTGEVLRTLESDRFVTGVTWVDDELWHGTWEGEESSLRRIDPETGEVFDRLDLPEGVGVSGLESDGGDLFYCGGGPSGKLRVVQRPPRTAG